MDERNLEARLRALEMSDLGFAKTLDSVVACVGGVAAYLKGGSENDALLQTVLDGLEEIRQGLARLSEFLGPELD